jgi:hypothetical protein
MLIRINENLFLTGNNNKLLMETNNNDRIRRNYSYKLRLLKGHVFINTEIPASYVLKMKLNSDDYLVESVDYITPEELTSDEVKKILLHISTEYKKY